MISPRWTPRATATFANLCGSSRQIPCPCRRSFGTNRSNGNEDGSETSRRRTSSRPTAEGQTPHYRTRLDTSSNAPRVDRRPRRPRTDSSKKDGDGGVDGDAKSSGDYWPQLQRRERAKRRADDGDSTANAALAIPKPTSIFTLRHNVQNPRGTKESSLVMLIIDGLSSNLNAADFYRIAPNDLSNWQSVIKKVQMQRTPDSFEPLGRYLLTFSTAQAAASYRDRLVRLHRLNGFKLRSASGLWESSVPAALKVSLTSPSAATAAAATAAVTETIGNLPAPSDSPSNTESVVDLANSFTIAPGSQETLLIQRRKVALVRPWANRLASMVENLGFGEVPHVLMLEVYPPTLSAKELHQFIRQDGESRGLRWPISAPQHLKMNNVEQAPSKTKGTSKKDMDEDEDEKDEAESDKQQSPSFRLNDRDTEEKLKGRFVLACTDEAEARRFQQSWNNRALMTLRPQPARYIVYASIINW
ncbi:hypothetical protein GGI43DRAFT_175908 [Trichoderma evansii]